MTCQRCAVLERALRVIDARRDHDIDHWCMCDACIAGRAWRGARAPADEALDAEAIAHHRAAADKMGPGDFSQCHSANSTSGGEPPPAPCATCGGSGEDPTAPPQDEEPCPTCHGARTVPTTYEWRGVQGDGEEPCPDCQRRRP